MPYTVKGDTIFIDNSKDNFLVFKNGKLVKNGNGREYTKGRFYKLVPMEGRVSILLGCLHASRTVSFCFAFSHVARYAPSWKTKNYGTIAANASQANL